MRARAACGIAVVLCAVLATAAGIRPACAAEFTDVPKWHWAWAYVQGVSDANITTGYGDGTYKPSLVVSRDQMAVFIARAMCGGDAKVPDGPPVATFADVPNTGYGPDGTDPFWAYKYVEYAVAHHVTAGFDDGLYHPDWEVTRGQMAAFMARAMCGGEQYVPAPSGSPRFPDVTSTLNSWCYKHVEYIASEGVTLGYPDGLYHPEIACARDQMAAYLCRAFDLPMPPQPYNVTDYFPLTEGSTWIYESSDGVYTTVATDTHLQDGEVHSRLVSSVGQAQVWHSQADGLVLDGLWSPDEGEVSFGPGLRIPNGIYPGDAGSQTSATTVNGLPAGDTQFGYQFVAAEDVVVPAGIFSGCMKIRLLIQPEGQPANQFYIWVAKGVGAVKLDSGDFGGDDWAVLIAANVGGRTYPSDVGPFRLADYWPLEVGSTWVYTGSEGVTIDQVVGARRVGELEAVQLDQGPAAGAPACTYHAVLDGAFCYLGRREAGGAPLLTFSPPIALPEMVSMGDSGSVTTQVYDDGSPAGDLTFEWAVVDAGMVATQAGEFANCLKLRVALTDPSDQRTESYIWLALGVGPVKEDDRPFGGDSWRELTSASVLGVQYPTTGRLFNITDYIDLTVGNSWTYDSSTLPALVTGTASARGYDWATIGNPAAVDVPYFHLRTDSDGLHYLGALGGGGSNLEFDPPLLIANGLAPGDDGGQTSACLDGSSNLGDAILDYSLDCIEAVATDAGLFPDCMRIGYRLHLPTMPTGVAQEGKAWFARGVGLVKAEDSVFGWMCTDCDAELTEASVAGVSYPPGDTAFTLTDYLPIAMGNQWAMFAQGEGTYASLMVVDGTQSVSGLGVTDTVYKVSRFGEEGYDGSDLIAIRTDGIAIYGHTDPSEGSIFIKPPLLIPNGARIGDSGSGSSTIYVWATDHWEPAGTLTSFWELADAGPITTLAGHFPDCVLIRWGVDAPGLGEVVNYYWYARGVGVVKRWEVEDAEWEEIMGATLGGVTIPAEVAPNTPVASAIPQGTGVGFDFSAGAVTAVPYDQDLSYIYVSAQDARLHSFDSHGIPRIGARGQYGFESMRAYSTFLPPEWDIWGQVWMQDFWVLGIGWNAVESAAPVKTREGRYALVRITSVTPTEVGIEYVYPYGLFGP